MLPRVTLSRSVARSQRLLTRAPRVALCASAPVCASQPTSPAAATTAPCRPPTMPLRRALSTNGTNGSNTPNAPQSHQSKVPASRMLPLTADCKPGVSPWQEEFEGVLPTFTPASMPFPAETDVVIIGAGISGLSTALALARRGLRPMLVEREFIGSGATGRNGGHMHPHTAEEEATVHKLFADLGEYGITPYDVDFEPRGGYSLAVDALPPIDHDKAHLVADTPPKPLTVEEVHTLVHQPLHARVSSSAAGAIHPMKLLVAYASILKKHFQIPVWQETNVTAIKRDPTTPRDQHRWLVQTSRGTLNARVVIHATNAWVSQLAPVLKDLVIPVRNHVLQTTPIQPHLTPAPSTPTSSSSPLWSGFSFLFNSGYDYMIQRPNHRVVLGGGRYLAPNMDTRTDDTSAKAILPYITDRLRAFLPQLFPAVLDAPVNASSVSVSHLWTGILGFTSTYDPIVGGLPQAMPSTFAASSTAVAVDAVEDVSTNGQFVLAGYSGHGMPRATKCADVVSDAVVAYLADSRTFRAESLARNTNAHAHQPAEEVLSLLKLTREDLQHLHRHHHHHAATNEPNHTRDGPLNDHVRSAKSNIL